MCSLRASCGWRDAHSGRLQCGSLPLVDTPRMVVEAMRNDSFDVHDMARIFHVSRDTIYKWARKGKLPPNADTFNRYGTPRRVWTQYQLDQWFREAA